MSLPCGMAVNRIRVIWSGTTIVGGGLTSFYFNSFAGTAAQQGSAVSAFLGATEASRSSGVSWEREPNVDTLNQVTGVLEGTTGLVASSGVGTASGDVLPRETQCLLREFTNTVVAGRLLRGRMFFPGATESMNSASGQPLAVITDDYDAAAGDLIADANTDWIVWSKTHGQIASVATASCWNSWAGLKSRRD